MRIEIRGSLAEHEDESGTLSLGAHPLAARWGEWLDELVPMREQAMGAGEQRFGSLTPHSPAGSSA